MFEEYQVVFVHLCPEEGSENSSSLLMFCKSTSGQLSRTSLADRVAIHPVFPGHVLFFRVINSVWPDFFEFGKMSGFFNK